MIKAVQDVSGDRLTTPQSQERRSWLAWIETASVNIEQVVSTPHFLLQTEALSSQAD